MNWEVCSAVECNPHKISGAWAFTGTRVPVYTLSEYMESGATMKQFLESYPEVKQSPGGCISPRFSPNELEEVCL